MKKKPSRCCYDYYTIAIPTDAFATKEEAGSHAIDEARERARLYCMPADWRAVLLSEGGLDFVFRVSRKRNRS
jgi:hypothetical protein